MQLTEEILTSQTLEIKAKYRLYMAQCSLEEVKECIKEADELIGEGNRVFYRLKASLVLIDDLINDIVDALSAVESYH